MADGGEYADSFEPGTLIDLDSHGFRGPVHDITVQQCEVQSVQDSSRWTVKDRNSLACNGIQVDGRNMTVRNCIFPNVDSGISVTAADSMIEGNTVENFAGDGMRGLGDNTTFQYNTVKNCYDVKPWRTCRPADLLCFRTDDMMLADVELGESPASASARVVVLGRPCNPLAWEAIHDSSHHPRSYGIAGLLLKAGVRPFHRPVMSE